MKILVATPCAHEVVTSTYAESLFNTAKHLERGGIETEIALHSLSDLEVSRSIFASRVLNELTFTHLLFLDSDMIWGPGLIDRMIGFDEAFVGAIYPRRSLDIARVMGAVREMGAGDKPDYEQLVSAQIDYVGAPFGASDGRARIDVEVRRGFMQAEHVGMGITLLKRVVLEIMVEKQAVDRSPTSPLPGPYYGFFHKLYAPDGEFWSEDISFCKRWSERCGGTIWACVDHQIGHRGTFKYFGTYLDKLRAGQR